MLLLQVEKVPPDELEGAAHDREWVCLLKPDLDAEPEESPGSSSSTGSSSTGAVNALSTAPAPPQPSAGQPAPSSCSGSDSPVDSSEEEDEDSEEEDSGEDSEEDPAMFSSKFLSGANPLSAMSSAVNKIGLFGDDGEGDKTQKPPQASGQGKGPPTQQQQRSQNPGQPQNGRSNGGPQAVKGPQGAAKPGNQPSQQVKGGTVEQSLKSGQRESPEQGLAKQKEAAKSDIGARPGVQQGQTKAAGQPKPGQQGALNAVGQTQGSAKPSPQQGSPNVGRQQQGTTKILQQGPPKPGQQGGSPVQGSPNAGRQQQGVAKPGQQGSPKPGQPPKSGVPPKSSGVKSRICSVCNTTELNMHTKDPPNFKTCTQCKTEVCSLCGFSPPDSNGKEWLCLTCQIHRAQDPAPSGQQMTKPPPSSNQKSPTPMKKDIAQSKPQPAAGPTKTDPTKGPKTTSEKPDANQQSGGLFGFGASKTDAAKSNESVTGKMFGFGSSFLSSASTLISSDETKTTPPISPKVQPASQAKKVEHERKQGQAKVENVDKASAILLKDVPLACPLCHTGLNSSSGKPNYNACMDCKGIVCNQCGFDPTPNVKEGKVWLCLNCQVKRAAGGTQPEAKKTMATPPTQQKTSTPASPQRKPPLAKDTNKEPGQPPGPTPTPSTQPKQGDQKSDSVSGKMFGFGSSIFSSASTLITQAVQDESKTTPPVSPKVSKESKASPIPAKKHEPERKAEEGKGQPKEQPKPQLGKQLCPLCKLQLNVGAKEPPNYSTCTQCKSIVCNQCGFNPRPNVTEEKEWLCLNCQMHKASGASDQQQQPMQNKKPSPAPGPAGAVKKEPSPQVQRKDLSKPTPGSPAPPGSPQRKPQAKPDKEPLKPVQRSPTPPKSIEASKSTDFKPSASQSIPGSTKAPPESTKPSESIGGKMFGFGSSIFSSASSMITTPPLSPKMPTAKTTKSPQIPRKDEEKKPGQVNQPNASSLPQAKVEKAPSQPGKQTAPAVPSKCPLCKIQLNVGSKDPPNYSTCTQCKETVCNQCGFSPVPNVTEVKEWLCLNCQVKRAASALEPQAPKLLKSPSRAPAAGEKTVTPAPGKKEAPPPAQKKPSEPQPQDKVNGAAEKKKVLDQKAPQPNAQKAPEQGTQSPRRQSKEQESGGLFGFGGPKAQPESAKPAESVGGKMFGFGSSIFSSASTLITSAVQDQPKTTPPVSPKLSPKPSPAKEAKSPAAQKPEENKKEEAKIPPAEQTKVDKGPPQPTKTAAPTQGPAVKPGQSTCPLCKVHLNINSRDPPNYSNCTECKSTVCNQCGFNPSPNELTGQVKEWLCLNCQVKRAAAAPGLQAPKLLKSPSRAPTAGEKTVTPAPEKKKTPPTAQKNLAEPQKQDKVSGAAEKKEVLDQKAPQPNAQKAPEQGTQSPRRQSKEQESGGLFGFGGPKAQPESAKPAESVGGKMFGFGSSIFSSASTLITSAVQDQPKTTPPVSPKLSPKPYPAKEAKSPAAPKPEENKKEEAKTVPPEQTKAAKGLPQPTKTTAPTQGSAVKPGQSTCPLCKVHLNISSKDPPNYSNCTECKSTVCNQCGFNPSPNELTGQVKEWLCLNCQVKRAAAALEPQAPKLPKSPSRASAAGAKTVTPAPEKKEAPPPAQKKPSEPQPQDKVRGAAEKKEVLDQKAPQPNAQKAPEQGTQSPRRQSKEQESGGLFGFGGPKAQPESAKPAESVGGKMFGFGSSIFSSASTLITSVQDQPKTTPPASPKLSPKPSPAKEDKSPAAQKPEENKKEEAKIPPAEQTKVDKGPPQPTKTAAPTQGPAVKPGQSTCPLCKVHLNINSRDPPNYSNCTECKSTVCNQCGFNPSPNELTGQVKEWLCLNCQVKRAAAAPGLQAPKLLKSPSRAPAAGEKTVTPAPEKKEAPPPAQKKPSEPQPQDKVSGAAEKKEVLGQKAPQPNAQKAPEQGTQSPRRQSKEQESGGLFGFGGPKAQPESAKPAESVGGKMFGFGSSIFSSASTLITSAVQDQPKTTPPVSPKLSPKPSPAKEAKSPAAQKPEENKKEEAKTAPPEQTNVDKGPPQPTKTTAPTQGSAVKPGQSTCPLCKVHLNISSKDPPNYSNCTECKSTVCNQCCFNPSPNELTGQVKEWLCLNCQVKRAAAAPELQAPKLLKSPSGASAAGEKRVTPAPEKKEAPLPAQKKPSELQPQDKVNEAAEKKEVLDQKAQQQNAQKAPEQGTQSPRRQSKEQESGGLFGFGGPKAQPESAKPAESVGGKMFGFGSSIFSSASTSITSAVQESPKTTPPASPKLSPKPSPAKEAKSPAAQKPEENKKEEAKTAPPEQTKVDKGLPQPTKAAAPTQGPAVKPGQSTCPLCKVHLNISSKDPPNYSNCTECKSTVCNQCGFNPSPNELTGQVKEWLCLNCQVKRAAAAPEPQALKLLKSPSGASAAGEKTGTPATEKQEFPTPAQKKPSEPQPQDKVNGAAEKKEVLDQKAPQPNAQKAPEQGTQSPRRQSKEQESGGLFGFGGPKAQPESAKPAESVGGKMFGFGSSIFSSASTLITSAVQDQPKTTPPVSPKLSPKPSPAKEAKSLAAQKPGENKKEEAKTAPPEQTKVDKGLPQPTKTATPTQGPAVNPGQSTCPLCKVHLNINSRDPPNYSNCTECKSTVCNQCGFNPSPNELTGQVKAWLCLNCQVKRAASAPELQAPKLLKSPSGASAAGAKTGSPAPEIKKAPQSAQKKPSEPQPQDKVSGAAEKKEVLDQKAPQPNSQKAPEQGTQSPRRQSKEQESGGLFGFGGPKAQPESAKPAESVGGKMFGFGSSIFSSASTLITSAVQDQPKTTAPVSPKLSPKPYPAKEAKSPAAQKPEENKKEEAKIPPAEQTKADKGLPQPTKAAAPTRGPAVKPGQSTCPLCKVHLNISSKDPPNYSNCTECKSTVCNQCGFNPLPNDVTEEPKTTPPTPRKMSTAQVSPKATPPPSPRTEKKPQEKSLVTERKVTPQPTKTPAGTKVKEWLCLDCQMKRAIGPSEASGLPAMKPLAQSKEQKDKPLSQKENLPEAETKKDFIPSAPPKKEVVSPTPHNKFPLTQFNNEAVPQTPPQKEAVSPTPPKKEAVIATPPKKEAVTPTPPKKEVPDIETSVTGAAPTQKGSLPKPQAVPGTQPAPQTKDIDQKQPPVTTLAQPTHPAKGKVNETPLKPTPKPEVKETTKQDVTKPLVQQPSKPAPAKAAPPSQPPKKEESGGFFGFGGPKTPAKTETAAGKMFGFGSSFLSSASTLITSAVQDEPKTTPPVSPKISPSKPKPEQQAPAKATPPVERKVELTKDKEVKQVSSACPLCKVELNIGSKDLPNYNTCTECKNKVCNLCGFNPTPHTAAKEWLCLSCQTQRALSGQLGDPGKMSQPAHPGVKEETQAAPPVKKVEPPTTPAEIKPVPPPVKAKPGIAPKPQTPPMQAKVEKVTPVTKTVPISGKLPDGKPIPPAKPITITPEKATEASKAAAVEDKKEAGKPTGPSTIPPTKATVAPVFTIPKSEVAEVVPVAQKKPSEVVTLAKDTEDVKVEAKLQTAVCKVEPESADEIKSEVTEEGAKAIGIQDAKEPKQEPTKEVEKPPITKQQAKVDSPFTGPSNDKNKPEVPPMSEEIKSAPMVCDTNENAIKQEASLAPKDPAKTERRRLSIQGMEESSESEHTPSPKVQRRRVRVTHVSSSSEDLKTESADSSGEDEEFIREQIMGMHDEDQMSLSDNKKDEDEVPEVVVDNAAPITIPTSVETVSAVKPYPKTVTKTSQEVTDPEFKRAMPVMRQRQSTDEEVESITESLSKGSSSVQASSFTPGSSPTSASSIEEDSDSSPSHRKITDKPHRKGKHRHPSQPLPTIEDSSEEERTREYGSSSEELRQVTVVSDKMSGSDPSGSVDPQAVQRGRKPSPTAIPFTHEPAQLIKTLKSADEAYEEILQKAKAIPGESPPDIEPMYGGMAIEDYLYESLVEESERICGSEELKIYIEPDKKLRSPEEVYEEMMQKKRELIMIEQELQEAQTLLEASAAAEIESCVVSMPFEEPSSPPLADEDVQKKKRPAPPRPTAPPKRTEGAIPSAPTGSANPSSNISSRANFYTVPCLTSFTTNFPCHSRVKFGNIILFIPGTNTTFIRFYSTVHTDSSNISYNPVTT
uniref:Zinc finger piccolo-type domain-containing protein n=1 Tax=Knipowitschia caucasica TaxID=637954 RepID=A0AAV2KQC0_KNICA